MDADRRPKILVVEDYQPERELLAELLEYEGFEVSVAVDAASAWRHLERSRFQAAIVDQLLGSDLGSELIRRARDSGHLSGTALFMVSAWPDLPRLEGAVVFRKPFDIDELVTRLKSAVQPAARPGEHGPFDT